MPAPSWTCANCHAPNPPATLLCQTCYTAIGRYCPACGLVIPVQAQTCPACGVNINSTLAGLQAERSSYQAQEETLRQENTATILNAPKNDAAQQSLNMIIASIVMGFIPCLGFFGGIIGLLGFIKAISVLTAPRIPNDEGSRQKARTAIILALTLALLSLVLGGVFLIWIIKYFN